MNDDMCPNCVTPSRCNGPHETPTPAEVTVARMDKLTQEQHQAGIAAAQRRMGRASANAFERPRRPTVEEAEAILTLVRGGWLKLELDL